MCSQSGKLNGTYSNIEGFQELYNYYTFNKNGDFEYHTGACLGDDFYGKGTYKIKGKRLILDYNKTKPKSLGYYNLSIWRNKSDSINLIVNVYDKQTKKPIEHANVFFMDSTTKLGYTGSVANKNGSVEIRTIKDGRKIELTVTYVGFDEQKIDLIRNKNYSVEVYLKDEGDETGTPILNQVDTLHVGKIRSKYFTVKNKNGSITRWRKIED